MDFKSIIVCSLLIGLCCGSEDLYKVLGIKKSASKKEIKAAYKKMAMEWHPDRNSDPNANEQFMKINEAYETLSDPEKKSDYDRFGKTSATNEQAPRGGPGFYSHGGDPFQSFFGRGGGFGNFKFDFGAGGGINDDLIDKFSINTKLYMDKILPESSKKPYFIYVYSDFCMRCMQVDRIFDKIVNDMENIGMGVGTVHANIARGLTYQLKVNAVPSLIVVIDGKTKFISGSIAVQNIRDFVRSIIPSYVVQKINDENYKSFLEGWQDNKVRMLFCDSKYEPSLRYLLPAFAHKHRFMAGYVDTKDNNVKQLLAKFRIQQKSETLLIFNEDTEHPAAQVGMNVLPRSTIDELMESNKHLMLPRLASQEIMNELCPVSSSIRRKSICVILFTQKGPEHDPHRSTLRIYAQQHKNEQERVRYTYIYKETQEKFVQQLTKGDNEITNATSGALKMAVMWRKDQNQIYYDWLDEGWHAGSGPEVENAQTRLELLVSGVLESKSAPPLIALMGFDLYNEHAYALPYRMYLRLCDWYDAVLDKIYGLDEVSFTMIVTSLACLAFMFVMLKSALADTGNRFDEPLPRRDRPQRFDARQQYSQLAPERPVVNITPMVASNFEELVLQQERGVRVLVLFVDDPSKMKLIKQFAAAVTPFSRSKGFKFAFLQLEDHLTWFRSLLERTIDGTTHDLSAINARNCLGTVLALNGPRKSYSMYHAAQERERADMERALGLADESEGEESDDGGVEGGARGGEDRLFEKDLLERLQPWLERLCEGQVKKFRIDKWPEMVEP